MYIRADKPIDDKNNYFEIMIESNNKNNDDNEKDEKTEILFDKGEGIYMGIGIADDTFNLANAASGWQQSNHGTGYYNGM